MMLNKPYSKVTIELKNNYDIDEIKELLSNKGETKINPFIKNNNHRSILSAGVNRKFDLNHLKALKAKEYVKK